MRTTIKDVAREAGVSIKTVSRVVNNERYVGADLRARVSAAIGTLNFRPNMAARSLAGRRSFQIALLCDNPSPYYVFQMQSGIRDRAEQDGVRMIAQPYDRGSPRLIEAIETLVGTTRLDGLILTPPLCDHAAILDLLDSQTLRIVRVSPGTRPGLAPGVAIDNEAAARLMVAHLVGRGYRRIAHVTGHPDYAASTQRAAGYRSGLAEAGLAYDPALVIEGSYDFASGAAAAAMLLTMPQPPDAIFAASDEMAAGALAEAHRRGLSIPGDVAVAGFGDDALAGHVWPALTTIRQPTRDFAWNAADMLLTDAPTGEMRWLDHALVVREST